MDLSKLDKIEEILGKPYFKTKGCLIYNMDCLEGMKKLSGKHQFERLKHFDLLSYSIETEDYEEQEEQEDEVPKRKRKQEEDNETLEVNSAESTNTDQFFFDLTVTSPPYNIGKEYESCKPLKEYIEWCEEWITQVHHLTQPYGAFWLNLGYLSIPEFAKAIPISYLLWDRVPFYLIQEVVWNYGAGVACRNYFSPRNEKWLWYTKSNEEYIFNLDDIRDKDVKYPNQTKNGKLRCNPLGKNPTDVWQIPKVTSGSGRACKERTSHPAQFPVAVIERIILGCTNPGDVILDPFLGSGTTAEVALKNNRVVVGFEIDSDYCDIAVNRLSSLISQGKEEKEEKPKKTVKKKRTSSGLD